MIKDDRHIVTKWLPTGLLEGMDKRSDDILLVAMNLEYVASKLVSNHEDLDDQFLELALPMVTRMYKKDPELIQKIPFTVFWIKMQRVFDELDLTEPQGYLASKMSKINSEIFAKRLYKQLKKLDIE